MPFIYLHTENKPGEVDPGTGNIGPGTGGTETETGGATFENACIVMPDFSDFSSEVVRDGEMDTYTRRLWA